VRVWKKKVFHATRWMGDVEESLSALRAGLRSPLDGERRSFSAALKDGLLEVRLLWGYPALDTADTCALQFGWWVVLDESDDQGNYLSAMPDEEFHQRFVREIPGT